MLTSATASILSAGAGATNILPAASTSSAGQNQSIRRDRATIIYRLMYSEEITLLETLSEKETSLVQKLKPMTGVYSSMMKKLEEVNDFDERTKASLKAKLEHANVLYLKEYAKNPPPRKAQVYGVTVSSSGKITILHKGGIPEVRDGFDGEGAAGEVTIAEGSRERPFGQDFEASILYAEGSRKIEGVTVTKQAPVITRKRLISPEPDTADEQDDDEDKIDSPKKKTDIGGNSADIEADSGGESDSESAENASLSELAKSIHSCDTGDAENEYNPLGLENVNAILDRLASKGRGDDGRGDDGRGDDGHSDDGSGDDGHAVTSIYRDSDSETAATNSKKRKTASKGGKGKVLSQKSKRIKNQKGEAKKNEPKQSPTKPVAKDSSSKAKRPNEIGVNDPIEVLHHYAKMVAIPHYSKMSRPELGR
ncbi:hypothetical protein BC829DRAFT_417271 [Chytridium lagenaria]|nr:hypothetical protein BC829DRAFT_417271 [Chytridium lagenaria]